eukprot:TRINITY_DN11279_c0_g1_i1.p1 TRINITY_DN11279_c0_g1~~TRINITY_DN11279_c0_g1_i1.p1  ORF type:complete len:154 (+),score=12.80 TRINITY_DN11279_c0_g1_i1:356-817(+)
MHKNTKTYENCPTPNCHQVFKKSEESIFSCDVCFKVYCLSCMKYGNGEAVEVHTGLSCKEYRTTLLDRGELFELLQEGGAIECPNCGTITFKDGGCNHMSCFACLKHYCWLCKFVADSGRDIYKHMTETHGKMELSNKLPTQMTSKKRNKVTD